MIQCPHCKNQIPDCSQRCPFCGVQFTPPAQVGMAYQPHNQSAGAYSSHLSMFRVKNHAGLAIGMAITAGLCFGPLLFDTIVYSLMRSSDVDKLLSQGRIQEAEQASKDAKKWSMYPIRVLLLIALCLFIVTIIPMLFSMKLSPLSK